jgi:hypothetical protein
VTGSGGTEQPYIGTTGLRPWQVVMGRKALRDLFGSDDIEDINQRIAAGENMALTQRRPSPLPKLTSTTPMQILTPEMARAQGLHHISKNFNGIAQAAMIPSKATSTATASGDAGRVLQHERHGKTEGLEGTKLEDAYLKDTCAGDDDGQHRQVPAGRIHVENLPRRRDHAAQD